MTEKTESSTNTTDIVNVRDLHVVFPGPRERLKRRQIHAVNGVDLRIRAGESVALVGESGSGKSTTGRALLGLVPSTAETIEVSGLDISTRDRHRLRLVRRRVQMVFQDPYSSLNPARTIGESIGEPLAFHGGVRGQALRDAVAAALDRVGLDEHCAQRYPYEFSGGQRQRIALARAMISQPELIVLDEALSALDVSTQNQVLNLLVSIRRDDEVAFLFVSHDLGVVKHIADMVAVMYFGRIVELAPVEDLFDRPLHPYTRTLLEASPVPDPAVQRHRLPLSAVGEVPDPLAPPPGCAFADRCPDRMPLCVDERPVPRAVDGHLVECHLYHHQPVPAVEPATSGGQHRELRNP